MTRDDIIATIRAHRAEIDKFGVKRLALFGSVARGEDRPESDVDFLVEFEDWGFKGFFKRHIRLKHLLEDLIGRKIDLILARSLRREFKPYVEKDLLDVA
jgi:hypothetical protein